MITVKSIAELEEKHGEKVHLLGKKLVTASRELILMPPKFLEIMK